METNFSKSHEEMQLERFKTVVEPKGWWHKEVEELKQQLADHIKREVMLRDGLKRADDLLTTSYDHVSPLVREALAATTDLDGLILCHAEPVAEVKKHTGSLNDMAIIVWSGKQPAEGTQLYRAWEPKL